MSLITDNSRILKSFTKSFVMWDYFLEILRWENLAHVKQDLNDIYNGKAECRRELIKSTTSCNIKISKVQYGGHNGHVTQSITSSNLLQILKVLSLKNS